MEKNSQYYGKNLWRDIFLSVPLVFFTSSILYLIAFQIAKWSWLEPARKIESDLSLMDVLGTLFLAPIVETFLLILLLNLLRDKQVKTVNASIIAAVFFSLAHALLDPLRFFGTVWSFFVFSKLYYAWCESSKTKGVYAAFFPHVGLNLVTIIIIYSS